MHLWFLMHVCLQNTVDQFIASEVLSSERLTLQIFSNTFNQEQSLLIDPPYVNFDPGHPSILMLPIHALYLSGLFCHVPGQTSYFHFGSSH